MKYILLILLIVGTAQADQHGKKDEAPPKELSQKGPKTIYFNNSEKIHEGIDLDSGDLKRKLLQDYDKLKTDPQRLQIFHDSTSQLGNAPEFRTRQRAYTEGLLTALAAESSQSASIFTTQKIVQAFAETKESPLAVSSLSYILKEYAKLVRAGQPPGQATLRVALLNLTKILTPDDALAEQRASDIEKSCAFFQTSQSISGGTRSKSPTKK